MAPGVAIAYTISVIDVIPDFVPVLGYVDDLVIVSGLLALTLLIIPDEIKFECALAQPRHMINLEYKHDAFGLTANCSLGFNCQNLD